MCRHTQLDTRYQLYIWDMSKQLVVSHINTDKGDPFVTQVCVAGCCIVLQCCTMCCTMLQCCRILQCLAVSCGVLQCVAVSCVMLQCVASRGSVLQCDTT